MLALYQPVATDLRLIVAVLKINNDLEQIGDLAVNIARKAAVVAVEPALDIPFDIAGMWEKVQAMLRDSLDALVNTNTQLAEAVYAHDDEVDRMKHEMRKKIEATARRESALALRAMNPTTALIHPISARKPPAPCWSRRNCCTLIGRREMGR